MLRKLRLPILAALVLGLFLAVGHGLPGTGVAVGGQVERPVVVELFTSQGCSSCPPADALLGELAERPDVLALSLHVDYWDYIGWTDPFASPEMTARQRAYARARGERMVYTPQMIIDGTVDVVGSREGAVLAAITSAARNQRGVAVDIDLETARVSVPEGAAPEGGADVWIVFFDDKHSSEIEAGENSGRKLTYHHVVREWRRLGTWTGTPFEAALGQDAVGPNAFDGCAIIVQARGAGPILGAAVMRPDAGS
jgi:hypothetical protein